MPRIYCMFVNGTAFASNTLKDDHFMNVIIMPTISVCLNRDRTLNALDFKWPS